MKRVRIILAVIIVLGTAGGVLAFKINEAKRNLLVCTAPLVNNVCQLPCNPGLPLPRKVVIGGPVICYTIVPQLVNCGSRLCLVSVQTGFE